MANPKLVEVTADNTMNVRNVTLKLKEAKKNSVRYDAIGDDPAITSAYVMKHLLTQPWPDTIQVTLTFPK